MANLDVRQWIELVESNGELRRVNGADRQEEIGGLVDFYQRKMGRPALLFDEIPGYPKGYRVLTNLLTSVKRIALSLGLPADSREMDLVKFWRKYLKGSALMAPVEVATGPCMENVLTGKDVNILKVPHAQVARARRRADDRHGVHGPDPRPRYRLGELWGLPRAGL